MSQDELPRSFRLPASRRLRPIQQGELDGFCGVYSLINAIRLARANHAPLQWDELDALFSFALYRLAECGDLRERATRGVPWGILKRLGTRMTAVASPPGLTLELSLINRFAVDRVSTMKHSLLNGSPLIASLHRHEHYSVIVGWSPTRALLFDSSASHWVKLTSLNQALCVRIVALRSGSASDLKKRLR